MKISSFVTVLRSHSPTPPILLTKWDNSKEKRLELFYYRYGLTGSEWLKFNSLCFLGCCAVNIILPNKIQKWIWDKADAFWVIMCHTTYNYIDFYLQPNNRVAFTIHFFFHHVRSCCFHVDCGQWNTSNSFEFSVLFHVKHIIIYIIIISFTNGKENCRIKEKINCNYESVCIMYVCMSGKWEWWMNGSIRQLFVLVAATSSGSIDINNVYDILLCIIYYLLLLLKF